MGHGTDDPICGLMGSSTPPAGGAAARQETTAIVPSTIARRIADVGLALLVAAVLALGALPHVAPQLGVEPVVIRGRSMSPTIPLGAIVFVREVAPEEVRAGDVVTIRADNNVLFTHRVVEVIAAADGPAFRTQGDANVSPDHSLAPARALVGRVDAHLPLVGYLMVLLGRPQGIATVLALGLFLFLLARFADRPRKGDGDATATAARGAEQTAARLQDRHVRPLGTVE